MSRRTPRLSLTVTAVVLCAVARPAGAAVVTRAVNVTLDAANLDAYALDLDQNGTTDFTFQAAYAPDPTLTVGFDQIEFPFASGNAAVVDVQTGDGFPAASRLSPGAVVSAASAFSGPNDQANLYSFDTFDPETGNFGGRTGFVGLRFAGAGGATFFGSAQVTVNDMNAARPDDLTIGTVAYNNVAGQPLTVAAVPEPTTAVVAAIAALAVGRRRRREMTNE